jgi:hypothetical protein
MADTTRGNWKVFQSGFIIIEDITDHENRQTSSKKETFIRVTIISISGTDDLLLKTSLTN